MGLRQTFRFRHGTGDEVRTFLRGFSHTVDIEDRHDFFVFTSRGQAKPYSMEFELVEEGLRLDRAGKYSWFLGVFVESITGQIGAVEVEDT